MHFESHCLWLGTVYATLSFSSKTRKPYSNFTSSYPFRNREGTYKEFLSIPTPETPSLITPLSTPVKLVLQSAITSFICTNVKNLTIYFLWLLASPKNTSTYFYSYFQPSTTQIASLPFLPFLIKILLWTTLDFSLLTHLIMTISKFFQIMFFMPSPTLARNPCNPDEILPMILC